MSRLTLILAALGGAGALAAPHGPDDAAGCREALSHYVHVTNDEGHSGAGSVVDAAGERLVLTACHLLRKRDGKWLPVTVSRIDARSHVEVEADVVAAGDPETLDLALLRPFRDVGVPPAVVDCDTRPRAGDACYSAGSNHGVYGFVDRGVIATDLPWGYGGVPYTVVNASTWFGNSGGGLYVSRGGKLVLAGVVVRVMNTDPHAPGLAVLPGTVKKFLDDYKRSKK